MVGSNGSTPALQDGRFLILQAIGRGGMAVVYRAFDRVEQRLVALKVPLDDGGSSPGHPFAEEFRRWRPLFHRNVVRARGLSVAGSGPLASGRPYLVLEHVAGGRIDRVLAPGAERPEVVELVAGQLLRALGHVHAAALIHRDVKPANVLVGRGTDGGWELKLTDFGLASPRGEREEAGRVSGSLPFVAPETLLGGPMDERTDLYGLGILLHQLATGALPAPTRSVDGLIRWHLSGPPADPRRLRPEFPARLARFIARLTRRDPSRRPADCASAALGLAEGIGRSRRAVERPRRVRARNRPAKPAVSSLRAGLRLALDAARLGDRRRFVLPRGGDLARELAEAVETWTQVHGGFFERLAPPSTARPVPLARLVLRLCVEDTPSRPLPAGIVPAHLGLTTLDGVPLWGLCGPPAERADPAAVEPLAARLSRFVLDRRGRRTLVLHVGHAARRDPLTRHVVRLLIRECARPSAPRRGQGGVLLVDDGGSMGRHIAPRGVCLAGRS